MSIFCQRSHHRKCQHRWIGGQKKPKSCQRSLWTTPNVKTICWKISDLLWWGFEPKIQNNFASKTRKSQNNWPLHFTSMTNYLSAASWTIAIICLAHNYHSCHNMYLQVRAEKYITLRTVTSNVAAQIILADEMNAICQSI